MRQAAHLVIAALGALQAHVLKQRAVFAHLKALRVCARPFQIGEQAEAILQHVP